MGITIKGNTIICSDCGHENIDKEKCEKCGTLLIKIEGGKITIGQRTTPSPVANTDFLALLKLTLAVIKVESQPVVGHKNPDNVEKLWEAAFDLLEEFDKPKTGDEH